MKKSKIILFVIFEIVLSFILCVIMSSFFVSRPMGNEMHLMRWQPFLVVTLPVWIVVAAFCGVFKKKENVRKRVLLFAIVCLLSIVVTFIVRMLTGTIPLSWWLDYLRIFATLFAIVNSMLDGGILLHLWWIRLSPERKSAFINAIFGFLIGVLFVSSRYTSHFDGLSRILIVALATYAGSRVCPLFLSGKWKGYAPTCVKCIALACIIVYASFASVFNQIVVSAKDFHVGLSALCLVVVTVILWTLFTFAFLCGFERSQQYIVDKSDAIVPASMSRQAIIKFWLKIFMIIMAGYSFWMIACFPANMSPDSIDSWQQAISEKKLNNWHPIAYTLLMRASVAFIRSPFMMVLAQSVVQAAMWAFAAVYLQYCGAHRYFVYSVVTFVALAPTNGMMATTLWKDVVFAIAMLGLTVSCAWVAGKRKLSFMKYVMLIVTIFLVGLTRHNGFIPAIVTSIVLSVVYLKRWFRFLPIVGVILIFFTQTVVYKSLDADTKTMSGGVIALYAIGSVFHYDGDIDNETKTLLTQRIPEGKWKRDYSPYYADPYIWPMEQPPVNDVLKDIDSKAMLRIYLNLLKKNYFTMLYHHLTSSEIHWAIFQGTNSKAYSNRYCLGIWDPEHRIGSLRVYSKVVGENSFTYVASRILAESTRSSMIDMLLWRGGVYIVLCLLLAYCAWLKCCNRINLVLVPIFSNFLIMCLINQAQDYRYTYQVFLVFPFILMFYLSSSAEGTSKPASVID